MLKCELGNRPGHDVIQCSGALFEITSDLVTLVSEVYRAIKSQNDLDAYIFRKVFKNVINETMYEFWDRPDPMEDSDGICRVTFTAGKNFIGGERSESDAHSGN